MTRGSSRSHLRRCDTYIVPRMRPEAARRPMSTAFFYLGEIVGYVCVEVLVTTTPDPRTEDYITGGGGCQRSLLCASTPIKRTKVS